MGKDRGPIFTAVSAPRGGGQFVPQRPPMGQLPLMQLGYDAAQLMAQEYRTMTIRRRHARIADLEAQLANNPLPGFHQVRPSSGTCLYAMAVRHTRCSQGVRQTMLAGMLLHDCNDSFRSFT